jgi:pyrimidine operon attenuation protein/uracil phosphoribosyltransferase
MNEIFDYGRPASITLVTLVDRKGCRELPIQPDIFALQMQCHQTLKLTGPEPLTITLVEHTETA